MASFPAEVLLKVLQAAAQSGGQPLYPAVHAAQSGMDREVLDQALDHLRLAGLVRLTDWTTGKGQGYVVTAEGAQVLQGRDQVERLAARPRAKPALTRIRAPAHSAWERGETLRDALLQPAPPFATMTLLFLNILVFVGGLSLALSQGVSLEQYLGGNLSASPGRPGQPHEDRLGALLNNLGALRPGLVLGQDQWWRLLSYGFLHGGLIHLAFNMLGLYFLGPAVEAMWGRWRFLALYFTAMIAGGCAALLALQPVVGASGAISGLLTSLLAWVLLNRNALPPRLVSGFMSGIIANLIFLAYFSFMPGVSWQGHLGGALGGALIAVPLNWQRFATGWRRWLGALGIILVPVAAVALVLFVRGAERARLRDVLAIDALRVELVEAEHGCSDAYNKELLPMLEPSKRFKDAKDLERQFPNARAAFAKAQASLAPVLAQFQNAGPFADEKFSHAAQTTRAYLEAWDLLFSWAKTYCEAPVVENGHALTNQFELLLGLMAEQRKDAVFRSALELKKDGQKKAQAGKG